VTLVLAVQVLAVGAGVGFLGGLFGKGGSAVATPLLAAMGVPAFAAVASPLPATIPSTVVAADRYRRAGLVDRRLVLWSIAAGLPATLLGALVTRWVDGERLVVVSEVVLVLVGLRVLFGRSSAPRVEEPEGGPAPTPTPTARALAVGGTVGFVGGLLANAGGFLLAPLYLLFAHLPIKAALGASLAVSAVLAVPGTVVHASLGHVDWAVTAVFALGSVPLSRLGSRVALASPSPALERLYGAGLVVIGGTTLLVGAVGG
jgi:uncharacterized membrane protein YfcA